MKWLISRTNSVWGLKKNGRGVQFYSHIINFPDDKDDVKKAEFLNDHVFTNLNEDYREAVKKMPNKAYRNRDANSTEFRIDRLKEYPNLSPDELLNHDFAVAYDEETGKYSYWAITGQLAQDSQGRVNENIIDFEATRDWMFELGIENIYDDNKQVEMLRGHVPDVVDGKWNIGMDSDNAFVEEIENFNEENYTPTEINEIQIDYDKEQIPTFFYAFTNNAQAILLNSANDIIIKSSLSGVLGTKIIDKYWIVWNANDIYVYDILKKTWKKIFSQMGAGSNSPLLIDKVINAENDSFCFRTGRDMGKIYLYDMITEKTINYQTNNIEIYKWLSIVFGTEGELIVFYLGNKKGNNYINLYFSKSKKDGSWSDKVQSVIASSKNDIWGLINKGAYAWIILKSGKAIIIADEIKEVSIKNFPKAYLAAYEYLPTNNGCMAQSTDDYKNYKFCEIRVSPSNVEIFNTKEFVVKNYTISHLENTRWSLRVRNINMEIKSNITSGGTSPFDSWGELIKYSINELLNKNSIGIFFIQLKDNILDLGGTEEVQDKITFKNPPKVDISTLETSITNNYYVMIVPMFKYKYNDQRYTYLSFNEIYTKLESSPYVYKITINQINLFTEKDFEYFLVNNEWTINPTKNSSFQLIEGKFSKDGSKSLFLFKKNILDYEVISNTYNINNSNYDKDIGKEFLPNNIAKLHKYPYIRDYVKTSGESKMFILPQLLKDKWKLKMSYSWGIENEHLVFKIQDIDNILGIYNTDLRYNIYYQDVNTLSLLQTNEPYKQYLIRNRDQLQQRSRYNQSRKSINDAELVINLARGIATTIFGGAGALWGLFTGNIPSAIVGGAHLAQGAIDIASAGLTHEQKRLEIMNDIAMQKAMLSDLKNSPNSLQGNGSDLNMWITKTSFNPIYVHEELWPTLKNSCAWYFHLFGSNLSGLPKNINNYLNNKYYFNHIRTNSTFENYKTNIFLNNNIRQINDLSLRDGITIWHYRSKETFKGIKNYNVNNIDFKEE